MESGETIFRLAICLVLWRLVRSVDFARAAPGGPPRSNSTPQPGPQENLPGNMFDGVYRANLWQSTQLSVSIVSGFVEVIPVALALGCIRRFAASRAGMSLRRLGEKTGLRVRQEDFL